MVRISFEVVEKKLIRLQHITIFETVQTSNSKMVTNQAAE